MNEPRIHGFDYRILPGSNGVSINAAVGGNGSPVVLLAESPKSAAPRSYTLPPRRHPKQNHPSSAVS